MLHVSDQSRLRWEEFPGVRATLERWGLIPGGSPRSVVTRLGINVRKVVTRDHDAVKASLRFLARHPADVIVLAVHQRDGRMRWFQKSVGKPIARRSGQSRCSSRVASRGSCRARPAPSRCATSSSRSLRSRARSQPSTPWRVSSAISSSQMAPLPYFTSEAPSTHLPCDVLTSQAGPGAG